MVMEKSWEQNCKVCGNPEYVYPDMFHRIPCIPQGLHTTSKYKVVAWDLLEGHKNPAPLSWVWFGAVRLERKTLKYEEQLR